MIQRVQEKRLVDLLDRFPVVAVIGPRQVGKSTLVQRPNIGSGRKYITLDDYDALGLAEKDPKAFLTSSTPITIDEVQRCPSLLRYIKVAVDEKRKKGHFLLTGSAALDFVANFSSELAGRVGVMPLSPLSWRECEGRMEPPFWLSLLDETTLAESACTEKSRAPRISVEKALFAGGYPLAVTASDQAARNDWFASFRFTYLERDVRQISNIGNLAEFARLFQTVAGRTAQLLNSAALARDVGLKPATAGRYLSLLEASFQMTRLEPWFVNMGKRLVKTPKMYWSDSGFLLHMLGIRTVAELTAQHMDGPVIETFAMLEVLKQVEAYRSSARVYFLRSHDGVELDGLIVDGVKHLPFEIKASSTIRPGDAKHLETYMALTGKTCIGIVFYQGKEPRRLGHNVIALPLNVLAGP